MRMLFEYEKFKMDNVEYHACIDIDKRQLVIYYIDGETRVFLSEDKIKKNSGSNLR